MKSLRRPNILIIYTDQQRQDSLGCYGNNIINTPNLDKLASEGCRLDNFFVQNPVCSPSRMCFLTGRYCSSLGIGQNGIPFPEDAVSINNILKPYGYHSAQIGKLHFLPHSNRNHKDPTSTYGFDTFILSDEPGCYNDAYLKWIELFDPDMIEKAAVGIPLLERSKDYGELPKTNKPRKFSKPYIFEAEEDLTHSSFVASETCKFLKTRKGKEPFFAIAGFFAPHPPLNPPERFVEMYNLEDMPLPKISESDPVKPNLDKDTFNSIKKIRLYYIALVSHVDDCVGRILNTLKKTGLDENTIVIFTSDHGENLGDHKRGGKGLPGFDTVIRVPFIIKYPDIIEPGTSTKELVEAVDIVPTLLDFCGVQTPRYVQGKSVASLLEGKQKVHREDIYMEHFSKYNNKNCTVRSKEYMYFCNTEGLELLYDIKNDPYQLRDISKEKEYSDILSEMRKRMILRIQSAALGLYEREARF